MKHKLFIFVSLFIAVTIFFSRRIFFSDNGKKCKDITEYLSMAKNFQAQDRLDETIKCYKKVLEINPNNLNANFNVAVNYLNHENYDAALKGFKRSAKLMPHIDSIKLVIARIYHTIGKFQQAIDGYKKVIKMNPYNIGARRNLSFMYRLLGDFEKGWAERDIVDKIWHETTKKKILKKQWNGSDLKGKTLFIRDRGANGDMFCWIRYAKLLKQQGAKIIVETFSYRIPFLSQQIPILNFLSLESFSPHFLINV